MGGKKDKPHHIPWRDRLRLISNALYERELSALSDLPVSPLLCLHLSLLFIFIFFFPLTSTHPSSTIPCISFIWLSASFLRIYQDFTLNCFLFFLALSLSLYMLRAFVMKLKFLPYSQNRHIDSRFSRRNKIFWTLLGRSGCNFDTKR